MTRGRSEVLLPRFPAGVRSWQVSVGGGEAALQCCDQPADVAPPASGAVQLEGVVAAEADHDEVRRAVGDLGVHERQ
ncbi:MAG TPA: hypothetical protein VIY27_07940 [Myxococcota bacterium]